MKKTFQILLSVVALSSIACVPVFAEADAKPKKEKKAKKGKEGKKKPGGKEWIQQQVNDLDKVVTGLTDEQKTKLTDLFKERNAGMKALKEAQKAGGNAEELKTKRKALWKGHDAKLKEVLTKEQYAKYKAYVKAKTSKAKEAK